MHFEACCNYRIVLYDTPSYNRFQVFRLTIGGRHCITTNTNYFSIALTSARRSEFVVDIMANQACFVCGSQLKPRCTCTTIGREAITKLAQLGLKLKLVGDYELDEGWFEGSDYAIPI